MKRTVWNWGIRGWRQTAYPPFQTPLGRVRWQKYRPWYIEKKLCTFLKRKVHYAASASHNVIMCRKCAEQLDKGTFSGYRLTRHWNCAHALKKIKYVLNWMGRGLADEGWCWRVFFSWICLQWTVEQSALTCWAKVLDVKNIFHRSNNEATSQDYVKKISKHQKRLVKESHLAKEISPAYILRIRFLQTTSAFLQRGIPAHCIEWWPWHGMGGGLGDTD